MAKVDQIGESIYRISTFVPQAGVVFAQFLIEDEHPVLFHTGQRMLFPETIEGVKSILDPAKVRYISWSHFEADECGALNEFLNAAPRATPVHSELGASINVNDFSVKPAKVVGDDEVLDLGRHKLRFLVTPQVPHAWDAILAFEETTRTLFASDLFTLMGDPAAITDHDVVGPSVDAVQKFPDYYAPTARTRATYDRLIGLKPDVLACMHGPAYTGDAAEALSDLRDALFAL